jgi:hypothetical protein
MLVTNPRRLLSALSAVALAVGVSACGHKTAHPHSEPFVDGSASSGFYIDAGKITYQVEISRELNPYNTEDKTYIQGVPPADLSVSPSQEWFAIFLWAKNQSSSPAYTSGRFTITDTQGNTYYPIPLNSAENDLAWTPMLLRPEQSQPLADSPAFYSPTQGAEVLFKINDSVYSNRPLLLNIYAQGQAKPSQISLDL